MPTIDCPECAGDMPDTGHILHCEKCGASFKTKIKVKVRNHEYTYPVEYAKAHLKAAETLLNSIG